MNKAPSFIRRHKALTGVIAAVVIIVLFIIGRGKSAPKFETATAAISNVVETVSVTGTVSPVDKADLAFEKGGEVAHIYAKVGDAVKAGDRIAALDSASDAANYEAAQATYEDAARGLRPEEASAAQSSVDSASVAQSSAESDAVNAVHDAFAKAQGSLVNYTDSLFNNPASINPTLTIPTDSYTTKTAIEQERVGVTQALSDWSADLSMASTSDASSAITKARSRLAVIKGFMTDLSAIVGKLTTANSNLTQTAINAYTASVNSALSAVNGATDSLASAQSALDSASSALVQAQTAYSLKAAGNSSQAVAAARAKADQAAAELAKDTIISPIDGIVTKVAPNEGEFVAAGSPQFAVQSNGDYKVEAYVPEADIAKVKVGDPASTTLDAYGPDTDFEAAVVSIDPAETVIEGVPTYKVTLDFSEKDERIRSGMTANLEIMTNRREGVVAVPYRAVTDDSGVKTVRLLAPGGASFATTTVSTGLKGSDGMVEIVSGLKQGDRVVTYVK